MATAVVRARIEEDVKEDATTVLKGMGLTVSDVIRMTLIRVARDRAIPFDLSLPNAETEAAMTEGRKLLDERRKRFANGEEHLNALDKAGE